MSDEGQIVVRIDEALASMARGESALRLRLGQALEALGRRGGASELGFSSLGAYAVERCERSVRWAEGARCLARRAQELPELREAIALGQVSWSMAEVLARVAMPEDEARWLALGQTRTVRQMRQLAASSAANDRSTGADLGGDEGNLPQVDADQANAGHTNAGHTNAASAGQVAAGQVNGSNGAQVDTVDGGQVNAGPVNAGPVDAVDTGPADAVNGRQVNPVAPNPAQVSRGWERAASNVAWAGDSGAWDEQTAGDAVTLTCTVEAEDAWLFEATRCLLEALGVYGGEAQSEALLAEAQATLMAQMPQHPIAFDGHPDVDAMQRRYAAALERSRAEAAAIRDEMKLPPRSPAPGADGRGRGTWADIALDAAAGMVSFESLSCHVIDGQVRTLARELACQEQEMSALALAFYRADGWRRLGYATEAQYARERLGISPSSFTARRALGAKLERLTHVAAALGSGEIGVEAALQVVRVATPNTEVAWVARARRRTIKHLREEVTAALAAVRWSGEVDCPPPTDDEIAAFQQLEQAVLSGRIAVESPAGAGGEAVAGDAVLGARGVAGAGGEAVAGDAVLGARGVAGAGGEAVAGDAVLGARRVAEPESDERRAWFVMLGSLAAWVRGALQMSAATPSASPKGWRVRVRLRMSAGNAAWWRGLEAQAKQWLPPGVSWLRFLCLSVWQGWRHLLGTEQAYAHIYARDRFRCTSPVCNRRNVTPHHLRFRSAGGSDADHNITSACAWCHLCGIHGGRIRARGRAPHIYWELGAPGCPCVVVDGRERITA